MWKTTRSGTSTNRFTTASCSTAEAFFEEPGVGLAGIEEIVIIWEDGVERLTNSPKTFW
jgi:Xaa-Pro aminopeptidase